MFFCSGALTGLFIKDPDTVAYGSAFLRGFCLAQPVLALDFMCVGTFQAVGMGRESLCSRSCAKSCSRFRCSFC